MSRTQKNEINKKEKNRKAQTKHTIKNGFKELPRERGITLVALVITMVLHYDKVKKCSNSNSFLLSSI